MTALGMKLAAEQMGMPDGLIVVGSAKESLAYLEERARRLAQRIAGHYRTVRRWEAADDVAWSGLARHSIARDKVELRAVLKARRVVRGHMEREQDAQDADAKAWAALRAQGLSEAEMREAAGR